MTRKKSSKVAKPFYSGLFLKQIRLSYGRLQELFKQKLRELGYPAERFGLHSLRAGSATAQPVQASQALFKWHSRWQSENAKDGYTEDPLESRFSVSQQLGLFKLEVKNKF